MNTFRRSIYCRCLALLSACFLAICLGEAAEENFDDSSIYVPGEPPPKSGIAFHIRSGEQPDAAVLVTKDYSTSSPNALMIADESSGPVTLQLIPGFTIQGSFKCQFDVLLDNLDTNWGIAMRTSGGINGPYIVLSKEHGIRAASQGVSGSGAPCIVPRLEPMTWYRFEFAVDMDARTYSLKVTNLNSNEEETKSELPFDSEEFSGPGILDFRSIRPEQQGSILYVDSLKIENP